jgi:hypothetical protein
MRPEDIDKLFKDRLGDISPKPSVDLWNRLQDRMEDELPQVNQKQNESKRSFMWVYTSIAASLSLLLAIGVVFYNIRSTPEISETAIAKIDKPVLQEIPTTVPLSETKNEVIPGKTDFEEKKYLAQATSKTEAASTILKDNNITKVHKIESSKNGGEHTALEQNPAKPQLANVAITESEKQVPQASQNVLASANSIKEANTNNLDAAPVEIVIRRSINSEIAKADEEANESGLQKRTQIAKNIFKQVRNLANGDEVELQALGIRADRVALETQIGNKRISKVINL